MQERQDRPVDNAAAPRGSWQSAADRTVAALGYELVDTERTGGGLLRITIDRLPGDPTGEFITVEDCEKVTRQLQHVLEVEGCDYARLEVSSPGLDRPLKTPAHYARFAGLEVEITLRLPFQGRKKWRGRLEKPQAESGGAEVGEGAWRLVFMDGKTEQALDFQFEEVREARLVPVVDFKGRRGKAAAPAGADPTAPREDDGGPDR